MGSRGVKFGWRVECAAQTCNKAVELWRHVGGPQLDGGGEHASGKLAGWSYWRPARGKGHRQTRDHVAYCPEHALPAKEWRLAFYKWQAERRAVAMTKRSSLIDIMARALCPDALYTYVNKQVSLTMDEWLKQNPEPQPPWKVSS